MIDFANACLSLRRLGNICLPGRDWLLRRLASTSLNAFPLESSAMCNKKAVLCTASFVISEHCFVQARQCSEKLKPLERVAFLLRFALVIPAGFEPTTHSLEGCCSIQLSYGTILCAIFSKCCAKVIHFFQIRYILSTNFRIKSNNRRLGRWLRFHTRTLSICSGRSLSSSLTP